MDNHFTVIHRHFYIRKCGTRSTDTFDFEHLTYSDTFRHLVSISPGSTAIRLYLREISKGRTIRINCRSHTNSRTVIRHTCIGETGIDTNTFSRFITLTRHQFKRKVIAGYRDLTFGQRRLLRLHGNRFGRPHRLCNGSRLHFRSRFRGSRFFGSRFRSDRRFLRLLLPYFCNSPNTSS